MWTLKLHKVHKTICTLRCNIDQTHSGISLLEKMNAVCYDTLVLSLLSTNATNRSSSKDISEICFHMETCHVGRIFGGKHLKRERLNVIRITLPAVPFNFLSCQVFPEARKLLCLHGCSLAWELPSLPGDIIPEPVGFERATELFDSIPEWILQLPCDPRRLSRNSGAVWRWSPPGVRRPCREGRSFIQTNPASF